MNQPAANDLDEFEDITATDFKKHFGRTLDEVLRGRAVRITRHGRMRDRLVLLREEDLARLRASVTSPLEDLRGQFDALLARMQTAEAREAAASVGSAGTGELGEAAVKGFRRGG
ncbi:MAG TPA: type II toxin-antitoxin system Phd/YefM family antitoxin [Gammaproteobacteria bacterium]|nr:type II toxin-antitoxin system Phd/YefM family antitoxin [Gammaproteobacteria bacterium]